MPLTHTRKFRIRYYECDANGHLNSANYLRMMQETAFDASTAAGYGMDRYDSMQRLWLIRESQVEFLIPLRYNQEVEVTTWISDFRRVTSRRAYEFRLLETGELAAKGFTDWVFLDTANNRPSGIPQSLVVDFFPEGAPADFPPRTPFPSAPPPPPGVFSIHRQVSWEDIDTMQHVNNAVYLDYLNECGFQVCRAFHWPWERMRDHGFAIFLRRVHIQYLLPAVLGDALEISTWVSGVKRVSVGRHYSFNRMEDGTRLVNAFTIGVWVDLRTQQPVHIPQDMLNDFAPNIVC